MAEAVMVVIASAEKEKDLSFAKFRAFWHEHNLKTLHLLRHNDEPESLFLSEVYEYLLNHLATSNLASVRIWCIYAMYIIFSTQPALDGVKTRIELPQELWKYLSELHNSFLTMRPPQNDAARVLAKMIREDQFVYTYRRTQQQPEWMVGTVAYSNVQMKPVSVLPTRAGAPVPVDPMVDPHGLAEFDPINPPLIKLEKLVDLKPLAELSHACREAEAALLRTNAAALGRDKFNAKVLGILAEYQTVVDNRPANRGRIVVPVAVPARETARTDLTQSAAAAAAAALLFDDDTSRMS